MNNRKPRFVWQILSAGFLTFLLVFPVLAQDPNPDSPTPILISEPDSTRALVSSAENLSAVKGRAFLPNSKTVLFVTNLDLMEGEGANAFRVNVEGANGRQYRFPVLDIQPIKNQEGIYALTIRLKDELGFWEQPVLKGDFLVSVVWRGLASNRVHLTFGKVGKGGLIKDDIGAVPTPLPNSASKNFTREFEENTVGYLYSGDRIRFLEQATFGPTSELDTRIRRIGLRTWLAEQFEMPYPTNPYPDLPLKSTTTQTGCQFPQGSEELRVCLRDFYSQYPLQNWFYQEAFYGDAQLKHRVAWALSELWVVSGVDTQQASWMIDYHQDLSKNAFGNYRNLMYDMTLNPAMGNYLDMVRSTKNSPNENYAREILQLFSVGLFMLNQDGTLQLDPNGNPIPTYSQNTVNNFTKVFTGWTLCEVTGATCPNRTAGAPNYKDPLILNQNNHDVTAKTLLEYPNAVNSTIAASQNGLTELNQALDNIFYHPNVAPFVSRYLIQQMVTSDPTPAYVGRVAAVFNDNGSGVRGDMKAVVRAILLDPEARGNIKTDPNYGKLREPVQLATTVLRQFDVQSATIGGQSDGYVNQIIAPMGQNTFNSPTVFNYYSPDYIIPGTAVNAPEFGILTTGTTIARANFINTIVFSRVNVSSFAPTGTSINLSEMQTLAAADATGNRLLDALNTKLMHGAMPTQMKSTILTAVQAVASSNTLLRAQTAIYLTASSSQYQVQR